MNGLTGLAPHHAVVLEWLWRGGLRKVGDVQQLFALGSDEELADRALSSGRLGGDGSVTRAWVVEGLAHWRRCFGGG